MQLDGALERLAARLEQRVDVAPQRGALVRPLLDPLHQPHGQQQQHCCRRRRLVTLSSTLRCGSDYQALDPFAEHLDPLTQLVAVGLSVAVAVAVAANKLGVSFVEFGEQRLGVLQVGAEVGRARRQLLVEQSGHALLQLTLHVQRLLHHVQATLVGVHQRAHVASRLLQLPMDACDHWRDAGGGKCCGCSSASLDRNVHVVELDA